MTFAGAPSVNVGEMLETLTLCPNLQNDSTLPPPPQDSSTDRARGGVKKAPPSLALIILLFKTGYSATPPIPANESAYSALLATYSAVLGTYSTILTVCLLGNIGLLVFPHKLYSL